MVCSRCSARYRWVKDRILDLRTGTPSYRVALWKIFYDLYSVLYHELEHRLALRYGFSKDMLRIEIVKSMNLIENNVVLEICASTGRNIGLFAKLVRGTYVALDASLGMLLKALKNVPEDVVPVHSLR